MGYGFFKGFDGLGTGLGKIGTGFLMDADEVNLGFFLGGGGGVVDDSSFGGSGLGAGDLT